MEYHDIVCLKLSSRRKGFPEFSNEILPRLALFVVECSTLAVTEDFLSALSFYKEPWYTSSLVINRVDVSLIRKLEVEAARMATAHKMSLKNKHLCNGDYILTSLPNQTQHN